MVIEEHEVLGCKVASLINAELSAGEYEVEFNINEGLRTMNKEHSRRDAFGTTKIYFYQLRIGEFVQTKKMIILK